MTVTSSSGSLPSHALIITFELPFAKLSNRESGQIDHVSDVEGKGNLIYMKACLVQYLLMMVLGFSCS